MQELGIPFTLISASEWNPEFRAFLEANHDPVHLYDKMDRQLQGVKCLKHEGEKEKCGVLSGCEYLVMGTPCNPFSPQRSKRFASGSLKSHSMYNTTFEDAYDLLSTCNPVCATMEQSCGFDMPEEKGAKTAPLQRRGVWVMCLTACPISIFFCGVRFSFRISYPIRILLVADAGLWQGWKRKTFSLAGSSPCTKWTWIFFWKSCVPGGPAVMQAVTVALQETGHGQINLHMFANRLR